MVSYSNRKRIVILASVAMFGGAFVANTMQLIGSINSQSSTAQEFAPQDTTLAERERGYSLVLEREPSNPVALKGLAETRLEMNNPQGAIAPLETLVNLHPEQAEYKNLLAEARQEVAQ